MPDEVRHDASDTPRRSATRYALSLEETALRFTEAGLPRNIRSLQRHCAAGRLDCIKEETVSGLAYFVDPQFRRARDHAACPASWNHRRSATWCDRARRVAPCRLRRSDENGG